MCPEKGTKAEEGLAGMCSGEQLRALGLSGWERRRLRGDPTAAHSFLRRGNRQGGAELFSLVHSARTHGEWLQVASIMTFHDPEGDQNLEKVSWRSD